MADWRGVREGLTQGYQVGKDTGGGRMGQLGSLIKGVADRLRSERETGSEELLQAIVDREGTIISFRPKGSVFQPKEPQKGLTLSGALGILSDPMKAREVKRTYPNLYKEAESVVTKELGEGVLSKVTPFSPPKKKKTESITQSNIMDTNW